MRILFWGTPDFAVPSLRALDDEGFEIVGVVTQPDRPAGRGRKLKSSPVKDVALELGFEVLEPKSPGTPEFIQRIRALEPDVSVVVAYGHILNDEVLNVPGMGSINVHASLLPKLRGAAPITWAIVRGHEETGITIMRMVREMDAGAIIHQVVEPVLPDETGSELSIRLSEIGAEAIVEGLAILSSGAAEEVEQDHSLATFAPKVDRASARIDWSASARDVGFLVRGMDTTPGAWTTLDGQPVKLFRPSVDDLGVASGSEPAGTVVAADSENGLVVQTGDGEVGFAEVQPPGGRRMSVVDWINGRRIEAGKRFE
ncbi:MAG: methionyl-tRNA formyltransferase [Gemmatimonadota bacterium]